MIQPADSYGIEGKRMVRFGPLLAVLALSVLGLCAQPSMAAGSCPASEDALQTLINSERIVTLSCDGPSTIFFSSTITVTNDVTLNASSSPGKITFDGEGEGEPAQLFTVNSSARFTLNSITLQSGHAHKFGGAINNNGTVTISNSTFYENRAGFTGGAIQNAGSLTVTSSTFVHNEAIRGGAIENTATGTLSVVNSTFSANVADEGGAIENDKTTSIANSTFSGDSARDAGGGAAISNSGTISIAGTITADSAGGGNCRNVGSVTDKGYNLADDAGASCGLSASRHDIVGQSPQLASLTDNGGPTQTMAPEERSPAIDVIPTASGLCPTTDQRGESRPDENEPVCDIGAYEHQDSCPTSESALQALIAGAATVALRCPTPTTIQITNTITITQDVTLDASRSPARITLDGGGSVQLFVNFAALTVNGVTLAHAKASAGGAIYNEGTATLTIDNSALSGNSAAGSGGAIWNGGSLNIANSTFSGNTAADAGGAIDIEASGTTTIINTTLTGNSANDGGAIANDNSASIANSTLAANSAAYQGAAISDTGMLSISASIVSAAGGEDCFSPGGIQDGGYNLEDEAAASCGFSQSSNDIVGESPQLGPLASYGGPTQTMALIAGSPAIDQIPTATGSCPATDQRGAKRPDGNEHVCDIGAYESGGGQLQQRTPPKTKLITCRTLTRTLITQIAHKRHKTHQTTIKCRSRRVTGKVKLRGAHRALATISRGRVRYAIGTNVSPGRGRLRMLVTELRPLVRGGYRLTLRHRQHHHWTVRRKVISFA